MRDVVIALGVTPESLPVEIDEVIGGDFLFTVPPFRNRNAWRQDQEPHALHAFLIAKGIRPAESRVTLIAAGAAVEAVRLFFESSLDRSLVDALILVSIDSKGGGRSLGYELGSEFEPFLTAATNEEAALFVGIACSPKAEADFHAAVRVTHRRPVAVAGQAFDRVAFEKHQPSRECSLSGPSGQESWESAQGEVLSAAGNAWVMRSPAESLDEIWLTSRIVLPSVLRAFLPGRWRRFTAEQRALARGLSVPSQQAPRSPPAQEPLRPRAPAASSPSQHAAPRAVPHRPAADAPSPSPWPPAAAPRQDDPRAAAHVPVTQDPRPQATDRAHPRVPSHREIEEILRAEAAASTIRRERKPTVLTPVQERIARSVAEKHAGPISHEDARLKVDLDMLARDAEEALADLRDGAVRAVGDLRHGVNAARKEGASMAEKAERKAEEVVEIADATSDMARSIKNAARKLRTFLGG